MNFPDVVLQDSPLPGLLGEWLEGNWFESLLAPYYDLMGETGLVVGLGFPLCGALYLQTGDYRVPALVLALFASLIIGGAPPLLAVALQLLVVAALALGGHRLVAGGNR